MRADLNIPIGDERLALLTMGWVEPTLEDAGGLLAWIDLHRPVDGTDEYEYKSEIKTLKLASIGLKSTQERVSVQLELARSLLRECQSKGVISAALVGRIAKFLAATKD